MKKQALARRHGINPLMHIGRPLSCGVHVEQKRFFVLVGQRLEKFSSKTILAAALLITVAVGIPDYLFGTRISLSIFYIIPVGLATWYAGKNSGFFVALLSGVPLLLEELHENYLASSPGIFFWNLILHWVTMGVIVILLERLSVHLHNEKNLARTDAVTGILNRRAFFERLQLSLDLMEREEISFALAYIDLDDFKEINDRDGHDEGDRVLRLVAGTLEKSIRHSDVVARLGGDEFALLFYGVSPEQASIFIAKIRRALHLAFEMDNMSVTCSIGCVTFKALAHDINSIIKAADMLMYKVKRGGKDGVVIAEFNPSAELVPADAY